jgi:hypothetical protein
MTGVPSGWLSTVYLSATPSASGHALVSLYSGSVNAAYDNLGYYVAFEVL